MRIHSKMWAVVGAFVLVGLGAGLAGFRFGAAASSTPAAIAQAPAALPSVTPRQSYAEIVDRVAPAVVTIRSARRIHAAQQFPFFDDPFFRQFFGNRYRERSPEDRTLLQHGLGSGVIVSADGYILTNHHVIDGAEQISVDLNDRRSSMRADRRIERGFAPGTFSPQSTASASTTPTDCAIASPPPHRAPRSP